MKRPKVNNGYGNGLENLANFVHGLLSEICLLFDCRRVSTEMRGAKEK
jgi:hypothetical protein